MIDGRPPKPGTRSFFAGYLAEWARRLSDRRIQYRAERSVFAAVSVAERKAYEQYCTRLLVQGLAHEITKQAPTVECRKDDDALRELHSIDVVVLSRSEYERLRDDLIPVSYTHLTLPTIYSV